MGAESHSRRSYKEKKSYTLQEFKPWLHSVLLETVLTELSQLN